MAFLCIGVLHFALRRVSRQKLPMPQTPYLVPASKNSYKIRIHKAKNMRVACCALCIRHVGRNLCIHARLRIRIRIHIHIRIRLASCYL